MRRIKATSMSALALQELLKDPFYTGLRHKRVRGEQYDTFLDNFMKACVKKCVRA